MKRNLVSVAGYDPSGGAGVLLDIAVFESLGHRGFGVLTAVTAQTPARVDRVHPVAPKAVAGQFERLAEAYDISGVKVGMLGTAANLGAVAGFLAGRRDVPRVVDPVLRSTSGALLLERRAWPSFLEALRGKAELVTPNLHEASVLSGRRVEDVAGMKSAAKAIALAGRMACLVKGGHLEGRAVDVLCDGGKVTVFEHARHDGASVHGTGCYLSSALVALLAEGRPLEEACGLAIRMTGAAIRAAVPAEGGRRVFDLSRERRRPRSRARSRDGRPASPGR